MNWFFLNELGCPAFEEDEMHTSGNPLQEEVHHSASRYDPEDSVVTKDTTPMTSPPVSHTPTEAPVVNASLSSLKESLIPAPVLPNNSPLLLPSLEVSMHKVFNNTSVPYLPSPITHSSWGITAHDAIMTETQEVYGVSSSCPNELSHFHIARSPVVRCHGHALTAATVKRRRTEMIFF